MMDFRYVFESPSAGCLLFALLARARAVASGFCDDNAAAPALSKLNAVSQHAKIYSASDENKSANYKLLAVFSPPCSCTRCVHKLKRAMQSAGFILIYLIRLRLPFISGKKAERLSIRALHGSIDSEFRKNRFSGSTTDRELLRLPTRLSGCY
jgi:hypothetical protein